MNRYKSIKLKVFAGGEGQKFFSDESSFDTSQGVQYDEKDGLKLAPLNNTQAVALTNTYKKSNFFKDDQYQYIVGYNTITSRFELHRRNNFGAFALIFTLPATVTAVYCGYAFKGKIFLSYIDGGAYQISYSSNQGTAFTVTAQTFGISAVENYENGKIIVATLDGGILYSSIDGFNFTQVFDFALSNLYYYSADYYNGFLYVIATGFVLVGTETLLTYYLFRYETASLKFIRKFTDINVNFDFLSFRDFAIFTYVKDNKIYIEKFNGIDFDLFYILDDVSYSQCRTIYANKDFCYFLIKPTSGVQKIFAINDQFSLFRFFDLGADEVGYIMTDFGGQIVLSIAESDGTFTIYNTQATFVASGTIDLSIFDFGEIVLKQIILLHSPLVANNSIELYEKRDQASSWSAVVVTSNTVASIKKIFDYASGVKVDFLQYRLKLITSDPNNTPKNISLELLYLPVGLKNSK